MAEIRFGKYSRAYEQFHIIFHISAGAVCLLMTAAAIFLENGFFYFPPVFLICALVFFVAAADLQKGVRKNKNKKGSIFYIALGIFFLITAVLSAVCFWM